MRDSNKRMRKKKEQVISISIDQHCDSSSKASTLFQDKSNTVFLKLNQ